MRQFTIHYKRFSLKVEVSEDNTKIYDSYQVTSLKDMKAILFLIKSRVNNNYAINKRGYKDMINEWRVHNLLYSLHLFRERTKDVDLNFPQSTLEKTIYSILSLLYFHYK